MSRSRRAAILALAAAGLAACSQGGSAGDPLLTRTVPRDVTIRVADLPGVGPALTDGHGYALYMFPPDAGRGVTCTGACAGTWPTLAVARGGRTNAGPGIVARGIGRTPDPTTGAEEVTYLGYPLYRYAGDLKPREANGQALFLNGGPWYVLSPSGTPFTSEPPNPS